MPDASRPGDPHRADLLAAVRAGVRAAVAASDYVDLPPELVSQRAWNRTRHAISDTSGAPGQAHELLRQYNLSAPKRRMWMELIVEALEAGEG